MEILAFRFAQSVSPDDPAAVIEGNVRQIVNQTVARWKRNLGGVHQKLGQLPLRNKHTVRKRSPTSEITAVVSSRLIACAPFSVKGITNLAPGPNVGEHLAVAFGGSAEFEIHHQTRAQLIALWEKGWTCFFDALGSLQKKDLKKIIYIRQEPLTVIDAVNRQLAHYPYHIGQIIYIGKLLRDKKWKSLSIPKGQSHTYNTTADIKDPAKKY